MKLFDAEGHWEVRGKVRRLSLFTKAIRVGYNYRRLVSNWDCLNSQDCSIMRERIDEYLTEREIRQLEHNFRRANLQFKSFLLQMPEEFVIDDVNSDHYRLCARKALFKDKAQPEIIMAHVQLPRSLCAGLSIPVFGMYSLQN